MRTWFTITTLWRPFEVILANPETAPDLDGKFGLTDIDAGIIYLDENLPPQGLVFTLMHELIHAMISSPGESIALALLLGCPEEQVHEREELLAIHLAPRLVEVFVRTGFLKLPEIPPAVVRAPD